MNSRQALMEQAISLAYENYKKGGWPFSALIVKDEHIIASGVNSVHLSYDPSDHAEIAAIRAATSKIKSTDLSNHEMYVVGIPCPMCLTCIVLSKISKIIYAVDVENKDAALQKLPPTDGLYNIVKNGYGYPTVQYEHLDEFSEQGVALFESWNQS